MSKQDKVLVVDDERFHLNVIVGLLEDEYTTIVAKNGEKALEIANSDAPPDIILLDVLMPEMDGYEVCRQLKANPRTSDIPVIFLTVKSDVEDETRGFDTGAADYIAKPFSPPIVRARVRNHLALGRALKALSRENDRLEEAVCQRTEEISLTQDVAIYCLTSLVETRDNETGNHIRRTQNYVKALAEHLKYHPRFTDELSDDAIRLMYKSAPLHDIGKVGVPDRILQKPARLDPEEWEIMKRHAEYGERAISQSEEKFGTNTFLRYARDIVSTHHEKWDGSGYPRGLKGEAIPLCGRLMALADVYDALISERVYKPRFSHHKAVAIIVEGRGTHFDPDIVDAFLALQEEFHHIATRFAD